MSAPYEHCRDDDCICVTEHPSGYCLAHRHLRPREDSLDHPGGDDDCDGYWDNEEPEVQLRDARY